jgi:hypothetical protein
MGSIIGSKLGHFFARETASALSRDDDWDGTTLTYAVPYVSSWHSLDIQRDFFPSSMEAHGARCWQAPTLD